MNSKSVSQCLLTGLLIPLLTSCLPSATIMNAEHKKDFLQKAFLSPDNHLCLVATDRYLILDLNKEFARNPVTEPELTSIPLGISQIPSHTPSWSDFSRGSPPPRKLAGFSQIPLDLDWLHGNRTQALTTNSDVLHLVGELDVYKSKRSWMHFVLWTTDRHFKGNPHLEFFIEQPVHLEYIYPSIWPNDIWGG
jgi:hypothetical protein